ncbi:MAG: class I SAM-dependent methyltransferase [Opitutales bacterium]|nr:class I SAM-dependent methyltransferase [Opitutales bacterium]
METPFQNLLYDRPELYEALYPEENEETPEMCRRVFRDYLAQPPRSILDIACGTGRDIRRLRRDCTDCTGVDLLPALIDYARSQAPEVSFHFGDMRTFRLDRTFDVVLCFGSAILYALSNEDLNQTFATFAAHSHPGSLLILDCRNGAALLGDGFRARMEGEIRVGDFTAHWIAEQSLNRRKQRLIRKRTWQFSTGGSAEDFCEYRLLFPLELERLIRSAGFRILGFFDNMKLRESDFSGPTVYLIAQRMAEGEAA